MKKTLLAIAFIVAIPACHKENTSKNMPAKSAPKKSQKMHKEHATKASAKAQPKNMQSNMQSMKKPYAKQ